MLHHARRIILSVLDPLHAPFARWMDVQTFRYLACGSANVGLDTLVYFVAYNFVLRRQVVHLAPSVAFEPYVAAMLIAFCISFPSGFWLMRTVVFTGSNLRGRVQLFRYALQVAVCIGLNYAFIKFFVEWCGFFPTPSKVLTTGLVAVFSYVSQRTFTFRAKPTVVEMNSEFGSRIPD